MLEVTVAVRLVWVEVAVVVSHTSKQLLSTGSMWVCSGHLDLSIAENDDSPSNLGFFSCFLNIFRYQPHVQWYAIVHILEAPTELSDVFVGRSRRVLRNGGALWGQRRATRGLALFSVIEHWEIPEISCSLPSGND